MAGDWLKMRVGLAQDLKVNRIARLLNGNEFFLEDVIPSWEYGVEREPGMCNVRSLQLLVVGALHRFWSIAQESSDDGHLPGCDVNDVDQMVGCPGFGAALIEVGWLEDLGVDGLQVHNWEAHNSDGAKKRSQTLKRVTKHRTCNAGPLPEKRREEKSKKESKPKKEPFRAPTPEQCAQYGPTIGLPADECQHFHDHHTARGWMLKAGKMKCWKAAMRTWKSNFDQGIFRPKGKPKVDEYGDEVDDSGFPVGTWKASADLNRRLLEGQD